MLSTHHQVHHNQFHHQVHHNVSPSSSSQPVSPSSSSQPVPQSVPSTLSLEIKETSPKYLDESLNKSIIAAGILNGCCEFYLDDAYYSIISIDTGTGTGTEEGTGTETKTDVINNGSHSINDNNIMKFSIKLKNIEVGNYELKYKKY